MHFIKSTYTTLSEGNDFPSSVLGLLLCD